ncbi:hypothetical protein HO173_008477 [Letharia columbiana]|uniref:Uncharacterized protein n=1 Tax=Letharia columbiana TaxID=112416 RepID=A0A8H6L2M3_9LECA|nr:uncharacterized protein HO173_008477 [Letharia columbiana]KAF6233188.1 hypothetical protein HO173_008477 [Letharia columbiana]
MNIASMSDGTLSNHLTMSATQKLDHLECEPPNQELLKRISPESKTCPPHNRRKSRKSLRQSATTRQGPPGVQAHAPPIDPGPASAGAGAADTEPMAADSARMKKNSSFMVSV